MSRAHLRVIPLRLGAAVLVVIAAVDVAADLGVLGRSTDPAPAARAAPARRVATTAGVGARVGTRAVRVVAPGARVRAGDRVDLLVTLDPDRFPGSEPTRAVGEGLVVLDVDRDDADPSARGVTLSVPRPLVARVAFAATAGTLTLAVVPDR